MGEWRQDPLTGDWVIIAPARGHRPGTERALSAEQQSLSAYDPDCPFCPGNEALLPALVHETPGATGAGWATRVVPNKYPAVISTPASSETGALPAVGFHQVIVETPRHDGDPARLSEAEMIAVIAAYRERYEALSRTSGIRSVLLFRNRGTAAGASLVHPHSQAVALQKMPPRLGRLRDCARRYHRRTGACLLCSVLAENGSKTARHVAETPGFRAFVPYAAAGPYELCIVPKRHMAAFADMTEAESDDFARLLQAILQAVAHGLADPPYNYVIESFGTPATADPALHWYLRLLPGLTTGGGFELGAGAAINPSSPERDAPLLRQMMA